MCRQQFRLSTREMKKILGQKLSGIETKLNKAQNKYEEFLALIEVTKMINELKNQWVVMYAQVTEEKPEESNAWLKEAAAQIEALERILTKAIEQLNEIEIAAQKNWKALVNSHKLPENTPMPTIPDFSDDEPIEIID